MNLSEPESLQNLAVKRGPGRPRKQALQPIDVIPGEPVLGHYSNLDNLNPVPANPEMPQPLVQRKQTLGDLYAAIDAAPKEWLPSLLAKVVKTSLKSGAWSDVENLVLSVRGFSK